MIAHVSYVTKASGALVPQLELIVVLMVEPPVSLELTDLVVSKVKVSGAYLPGPYASVCSTYLACVRLAKPPVCHAACGMWHGLLHVAGGTAF